MSDIAYGLKFDSNKDQLLVDFEKVSCAGVQAGLPGSWLVVCASLPVPISSKRVQRTSFLYSNISLLGLLVLTSSAGLPNVNRNPNL
jgi:hypothetical protein